ncbi:MAG: DUF2326 domain-containing protein [Candidatus Paceibacterota bacterium]
MSSLYSNKPDIFGPIQFRPGLNVVLGEIRLPENKKANVHNLGKTTLARVIDFCLCRGVTRDFFLIKHGELFKEFVFYIELHTIDGDYLTIRRSIESPTKLSIAKHSVPNQDFSGDPLIKWDHENLAFDVGKQLLEGLFGLAAVKPWDFRKPIGYALRTQNDFSDVFQLAKHRGKHREWKPYVAHILGFDARLVKKGYELSETIDELKRTIATLRLELGASEIELDQIRGLIELTSKEVADLESAVKRFDFELQDASINTILVNELDETIASLNGRRYLLSRTRKRLLDSLQAQQIQFRPDIAEKLFEEAGVLFPNQITKEFSDLIRFNKEISEERIQYLKEELEEINIELKRIAEKLEAVNKKRQAELAFLSDTETFSKYRDLNERLVGTKNELATLERQRDALLGIGEHEKQLRRIVREREDQLEALQSDLDACSGSNESRYSHIRAALADLSEQCIGHKALLTSRVNKEGNLEFHAEYLDTLDRPTSEDEGKSFRQVLCAAYDLAVARVLLPEDFIRFVYHDGLLEGLDDRIKLNVISVLRNLADLGIQQILTVIDSDLPLTLDGEKFAFDDEEIVLHLHDQGPQGRLFRMATW